MSHKRRTREDFEQILGRHGSLEEAVAACQALAEPGDIAQIHAGDCPFDRDGEGCDCEPIVVVMPKRTAAATVAPS